MGLFETPFLSKPLSGAFEIHIHKYKLYMQPEVPCRLVENMAYTSIINTT